VERNWSKAALAALDAYPWNSPGDKARAIGEAEMVAFGNNVEVEDLPLGVRQWLRRRAKDTPRHHWNGESWKELTEGFEKDILSQALEAHGGNVSAAARALGTTQRVVAYKARKYGLRRSTPYGNGN